MSKHVERKIAEGFGDLPPPAADALHTQVGGEAEQDCAPFQGKRWRELTPDVLDLHHYALFWFTPQAFHYYLPAFLTGGLAAPDAVFVVTILQILQPSDRESLAAFRQTRWALLSDSQIEALEAWLRWLLTQAPPGGVFAGEINDALKTVQQRFWW
jgi:hypothetical protein